MKKSFLSHSNSDKSCYVYSPHEGTTGREDMLIQWGSASYDPNTDSVKWKNAK